MADAAAGDAGEEFVPLRDTLVLGVSGAKPGTDMAIADLRQYAPALARNLLSQLLRLSFACSTHAVAAGAPAKIGLLAAGFDAHGSFIAGALYDEGMGKPQSLMNRGIEGASFAVMGGEEAGAQAHFGEKLAGLFPNGKHEADFEKLRASLLDAGQETIRLAAASGSRIDYRVMRRGQPAEAGTLT